MFDQSVEIIDTVKPLKLKYKNYVFYEKNI
jgi:hypothetical protein